jgi:hypothetical protein
MRTKMSNNSANHTQVSGDHYKSKAIQPWDYIVSNNLGYLEGNIVKYVSRYKEKGTPRADLLKARHYLDKLLEIVPDTTFRGEDVT